MNTLEEIRQALQRLPIGERRLIESWLRGLDSEPEMEGQVQEARPSYTTTGQDFMTLEEYLAREEQSPLKHEFINGAVFAMSGVSLTHSSITLNLAIAFSAHTKRGGPCEVFASDVKVLIQRNMNEIVYYPDVIVDCRPHTRGTHNVREPKLIVEVLSPSTQHIDRREKLQNYRLIDSVEEYVLAAQNEQRVTVYPRAEGWKPREYSGQGTAVEFRSIGLTVPLDELYGSALAGTPMPV